MVIKRNGQWVLKKKFLFAFGVLVVGSVIVLRGLTNAPEVDKIAILLSAYTTFAGTVLAMVFAADVTDKKLNGGGYNPQN